MLNLKEKTNQMGNDITSLRLKNQCKNCSKVNKTKKVVYKCEDCPVDEYKKQIKNNL